MFKRTLYLLALVTAASPGYAHESDGRVCNYRLQADIRLGDESVELTDLDDRKLVLQGDRLWIDGEEQALNPSERRRVADYRRGIEKMVPAIGDIALSGVTLGIEAATLAVSALSGDENPDMSKLNARMEKVAQRLRQKFDGRHLRRGMLGGDDFDAELDAEIESIAEETVRQVSGSVFSLMFTALFQPSKLEARGERVDQLVEQRVERRADALERQADALCEQVEHLDVLENSLGRFDVLARPASSI